MVSCINVTIVIKYLIQKKTCMNIQKFIQIVRETRKSRIDKKNKTTLKKLLKKNRVRVRINQI
jgi:hypothetical protein